MLKDLINPEIINEAYKRQIKALENLTQEQKRLADLKYILDKAISEMCQIEGFKLGGNDMARSAQIYEHCRDEDLALRIQEQKVNELEQFYKATGIETQKFITIIRYMEAIKDLPEDI